MIKLILILEQVRSSKGYLCPAGLEEGLGQGPAVLETPHRLEIGKKKIPANYFNNLSSSI